MKDFFKRLSIGALRTAFKHWREGTTRRLKHRLADAYERCIDLLSAILKGYILSIIFGSLLTFSLNVAMFGSFILMLPAIFPDAESAITLPIGLVCLIFGFCFFIGLILGAFFFVGRGRLQNQFGVKEVRRRLSRD